MLKSNLGNVTVKGNGAVIFAELEDVIRAIYDGLVDTLEDETEARRMIYKVVENAFTPEEEREEKVAMLKNKGDKVLDLIAQILEEIGDDDDDEEDV